MMRRVWAGWLRQAGHQVADPDAGGPAVEISSLFAEGREELKAKLPPDWRPTDPVVLDE